VKVYSFQELFLRLGGQKVRNGRGGGWGLGVSAFFVTNRHENSKG